MFSRLATLLPVAALVAVAAAAPGSSTSGGSSGGSSGSSSGSTTCSTGYQTCCNTSQTTVRHFPHPFPWMSYEFICLQSGFGLSSLTGGSVLSLLDGTTVLAGLTCDPITVIGALTGSSCTQQTVCCVDTSSVSLYYASIGNSY